MLLIVQETHSACGFDSVCVWGGGGQKCCNPSWQRCKIHRDAGGCRDEWCTSPHLPKLVLEKVFARENARYWGVFMFTSLGQTNTVVCFLINVDYIHNKLYPFTF